MKKAFDPEVFHEKNGIKAGVIEMGWNLNGYLDCGWGNGYVAVPADHPWHGKHYDNIEADAHGGLTFASSDDDGVWWVGFDTAHLGDSSTKWPKEEVQKETKRLFNQALKAYKRKNMKKFRLWLLLGFCFLAGRGFAQNVPSVQNADIRYDPVPIEILTPTMGILYEIKDAKKNIKIVTDYESVFNATRGFFTDSIRYITIQYHRDKGGKYMRYSIYIPMDMREEVEAYRKHINTEKK